MSANSTSKRSRRDAGSNPGCHTAENFQSLLSGWRLPTCYLKTTNTLSGKPPSTKTLNNHTKERLKDDLQGTVQAKTRWCHNKTRACPATSWASYQALLGKDPTSMIGHNIHKSKTLAAFFNFTNRITWLMKEWSISGFMGTQKGIFWKVPWALMIDRLHNTITALQPGIKGRDIHHIRG